MQVLLTLCTVLLLAPAATALDEPGYAEILERHTREVADSAGTRVDYASLAGSADWRRLVAGLTHARPDELPGRDAQLAFWINTYNILAIDLVVKGQPVESIRELGGIFTPVWKKPAGPVGGRTVTLDEIEHRILRPMGEPRIHMAIVCASTSCPSLLREPWTAARLEEQLDGAVRRFLADPNKGFRLERPRQSVKLSRIFDWFSEDFEAGGGVLAFVRAHVAEDAGAWLEANPDARIRYLDYDWDLNDIYR